MENFRVTIIADNNNTINMPHIQPMNKEIRIEIGHLNCLILL